MFKPLAKAVIVHSTLSVATDLSCDSLSLVQRVATKLNSSAEERKSDPYIETVVPETGWDYIPLDFKQGEEKRSFHNNFMGKGPDGGEEAIRLYKVGGKWPGIDMRIRAVGEWKNSWDRFYMQDYFGNINVKTNSSVTLLFDFVKGGTDTPVKLERFFFTIFDIDHHTDSRERVTFYSNVDKIYKTESCELEESGDAQSEEGLTFSSTKLGYGSDNPRDPTQLTQTQLDRSVTVAFKDKSSFKMKLTFEGGVANRNFLFASYSALVPTPSPTPVPTPPPTPAPTTTTTAPPKATTTTTTVEGEEESCTGSDCVVWGDPHIITFDAQLQRVKQHPQREAFFRTRNWKLDQVNVQETGTFWLVKSPSVHIQGRYSANSTHPDVVSLTALAVGGPFIDDNTLVVRPLSESTEWSGQEILQALPSQFENEHVTAHYHHESELVKDGQKGVGIDIVLPHGVRLTVNRWKNMLATKIHMKQEEGIEGQCGNFNLDAKDDTQEILMSRASNKKLEPHEFLFDRIVKDAPSTHSSQEFVRVNDKDTVSVGTKAKKRSFAVGDQVKVRDDKTAPWIPAEVTSAEPLLVRLPFSDVDLPWANVMHA